jgi:hypothetical protein
VGRRLAIVRLVLDFPQGRQSAPTCPKPDWPIAFHPRHLQSPRSRVPRQAFSPVVLPPSAMLPHETSCDLPLFHGTSEGEVWRSGRRLSSLLQHLCRR